MIGGCAGLRGPSIGAGVVACGAIARRLRIGRRGSHGAAGVGVLLALLCATILLGRAAAGSRARGGLALFVLVQRVGVHARAACQQHAAQGDNAPRHGAGGRFLRLLLVVEGDHGAGHKGVRRLGRSIRAGLLGGHIGHAGRGVGVEGLVGHVQVGVGVFPRVHVPILHVANGAAGGGAGGGVAAVRPVGHRGAGGTGGAGKPLQVFVAGEEVLQSGQRKHLEEAAADPSLHAVLIDVIPRGAADIAAFQDQRKGVLVKLLEHGAVGRGAEIDSVLGDIAVAGRSVGIVGFYGDGRRRRRRGERGEVLLHLLVAELAQLVVAHIAVERAVAGNMPAGILVVHLPGDIYHGILGEEHADLAIDGRDRTQRHVIAQRHVVAAQLRRHRRGRGRGRRRGRGVGGVVGVDESLRLLVGDVARHAVLHKAVLRLSQHRLAGRPHHAIHRALPVQVQQRVLLKHGDDGAVAQLRVRAQRRALGGEGVAGVHALAVALVSEGDLAGRSLSVFRKDDGLAGIAAEAVARRNERRVRQDGMLARAGKRGLLVGNKGSAGVGNIVYRHRAGDHHGRGEGEGKLRRRHSAVGREADRLAPFAHQRIPGGDEAHIGGKRVVARAAERDGLIRRDGRSAVGIVYGDAARYRAEGLILELHLRGRGHALLGYADRLRALADELVARRDQAGIRRNRMHRSADEREGLIGRDGRAVAQVAHGDGRGGFGGGLRLGISKGNLGGRGCAALRHRDHGAGRLLQGVVRRDLRRGGGDGVLARAGEGGNGIRSDG